MEFFNKETNLTKEDFKLHYCIEELNKKIVIRTLKNDIGLMLNHTSVQGKLLKDKNDNYTILKVKNKCMRNYYFYDVKTNQCIHIMQASGMLKKVAIDFYYTNNLPDSLKFSHFNINFKMQLNLLPKN